jgi:hypothetical protein
MGKYRKKPIVVEAVQWSGNNIEEVRDFASSQSLPVTFEPGRVYIETLEGVMAADIGDWIIRGVRGELYPCKPDIFAATYEEGDDDTRKE